MNFKIVNKIKDGREKYELKYKEKVIVESFNSENNLKEMIQMFIIFKSQEFGIIDKRVNRNKKIPSLSYYLKEAASNLKNGLDIYIEAIEVYADMEEKTEPLLHFVAKDCFDDCWSCLTYNGEVVFQIKEELDKVNIEDMLISFQYAIGMNNLGTIFIPKPKKLLEYDKTEVLSSIETDSQLYRDLVIDLQRISITNP